jgi:hypothetical protein
MTQQYLAGELSVLLGRVQAVTMTEAAGRETCALRTAAEMGPIQALGWVTVRALALTDRLCWKSLNRGDATAFTRQAAVSAALREFGVCAGCSPTGRPARHRRSIHRQVRSSGPAWARAGKARPAGNTTVRHAGARNGHPGCTRRPVQSLTRLAGGPCLPAVPSRCWSLAQVRSGRPASMPAPSAHAVSAVIDSIDVA